MGIYVDPSKLHNRGFKSNKVSDIWKRRPPRVSSDGARPAGGPKNRDKLPASSSGSPAPAKRVAATGVTQPSPPKRKAATGYTHTASPSSRKSSGSPPDRGITFKKAAARSSSGSLPDRKVTPRKEASAKTSAAKAKPVSQGNWNTGGAKTEKKNGYQYRATTKVEQKIKTRNK
jgi:hypothetical protein